MALFKEAEANSSAGARRRAMYLAESYAPYSFDSLKEVGAALDYAIARLAREYKQNNADVRRKLRAGDDITMSMRASRERVWEVLSARPEEVVLEKVRKEFGRVIEQADGEREEMERQMELSAREYVADMFGEGSFSLVRVSQADVVRSAKQMQQIIAKRQGEVLTNGTLRARVSDKTKRKAYSTQISERNLAAFGYDKDTAKIIHYTAASRIAELFEGAEGEPIFIENYKADDNAERTGAYHLFNTISIEGYGEFDVNINVLGYKDKNAENTLYQLELTIENPAPQEATLSDGGIRRAATPYTGAGSSERRLAAYRSFVENEMAEIKKISRKTEREDDRYVFSIRWRKRFTGGKPVPGPSS